MKKAFAKSIHKAGNRFYDYKEAVLTFKDPEDLHQMRVSGRTLLSYMFAIADKGEMDRPRYKKIHKPLKKAMSSLGALRDTDVLLEEVEAKLETFMPEERSIIEKWLAHKKGSAKPLENRLQKHCPHP